MSGIFTTFYLLFKSNAEDVIKGNKAVEKSTKDTERALKSENDTTKEVGQNFVKMAEAVASVAGAFSGLTILKAGISQAMDYNKQLGLMHGLLGQNVNTLDTFARAAEAAGGSTTGALGDFNGILSGFASRGQKIPDIADYLQGVREYIKNQTPNEKLRTLNDLAGIHDQGTQNFMINSSDAGFKRILGKYKSTLKPEDIQAVFNAQDTETVFAKSLTKFFTSLLTDIQKSFSSAAEKAAGALDSISNSPTATIGSAIGGTLLSIYGFKKFAGYAAKGIKSLLPRAAVVDKFALPAEEAAGGILGGPLGWALAIGSLGYVPYIEGLKKEREYFANKRKVQRPTLSQSLKDFDPNATPSSLPPVSSSFPADDNKAIGQHGSQRIEQILRAKQVLDSASHLSTATAPSININIDKLTVHTQATDAKGVAQSITDELKEAAQSSLQFLAAIFDDSRAM